MNSDGNKFFKKKDISAEEFKIVRDFLESGCGIVVGDKKKYLVRTRLAGLLVELGIDSYADLIYRARRDPMGRLLERIIDRMTTNETFWFRDKYPFAILGEMILPALLEDRKRQRKIRIWSSASSYGQEPYSIAMVVSDFCERRADCSPDRFEILATDISSNALETAGLGVYDTFDISRGLDNDYLRKYFFKKEDSWEVKDGLKRMIRFRKFNLQESFGGLGGFDVIFCRNVMIYFSFDFKKELAEKFKDSLREGGYFFMGMSESVLGLTRAFETVVHKGGVVYKKRGG